MLHFQLKEIPDDFFVDIVSRNNFLTTTLQVCVCVCVCVCVVCVPDNHLTGMCVCLMYVCMWLKVFFANLEEGGRSLDPRMVKKGLQFRDNLTRRYHWDFSSEPDEYAPTIVDTDHF